MRFFLKIPLIDGIVSVFDRLLDEWTHKKHFDWSRNFLKIGWNYERQLKCFFSPDIHHSSLYQYLSFMCLDPY